MVVSCAAVLVFAVGDAAAAPHLIHSGMSVSNVGQDDFSAYLSVGSHASMRSVAFRGDSGVRASLPGPRAFVLGKVWIGPTARLVHAVVRGSSIHLTVGGMPNVRVTLTLGNRPRLAFSNLDTGSLAFISQGAGRRVFSSTLSCGARGVARVSATLHAGHPLVKVFQTRGLCPA
jgi:hypothetical protein